MKQTFADDFVKYLQNIEDDRGKMATLRKGLIENQAQATWPLLSRFINFDSPYQIRALQTLAGLYAHHPAVTTKGNFGSLCYQLLDSDEKQKIGKGETGPVSRHFQYVLAADGDEIFSRVRPLIMRARKEKIPINYVQLMKDLFGWQSSFKKNRVKLAWGKEFWKVALETEDQEQRDGGDSND